MHLITNSVELQECFATRPPEPDVTTKVCGQIWSQSFCEYLVDQLIVEVELKNVEVAFPAEDADEKRDERGPLDAPDSDGNRTAIPGSDLKDSDEQEQELMDSLILEGFPQD